MITQTTQGLGWIGVGNMGSRMAARLLQAGYSMTVCGSGRRDLTAWAQQTGAALAAGPEEVAAGAQIFFSTIPNGSVLTELAEKLKTQDLSGKIWVDMSTVDAASSQKAAKRVEQAGGQFLRAPVTGSTHFAQEGTLGIMVSGSRAAFERCLPYLQILGTRQPYLGPGEEARAMKIIINMLLGNVLQAWGEALTLGEKLGLPWETMIDLVADSAAAAPIIRYKSETMKARDFRPTSTGYNMHKDMVLATQLAQSTDASLPLTALTQQMYNALMAMGLSSWDNTAVVLVNEAMNALAAPEPRQDESQTHTG